jgi:MtN3 and saliva related transmembrane protein
MGVNLIGWVSSMVLLLTLGQQVRLQWRSHESRGISTCLFIGQLAASVGFSVYSYLLDNWVFLLTNLLLVANAALGQWVTLRNRRSSPPQDNPQPAGHQPSQRPATSARA